MLKIKIEQEIKPKARPRVWISKGKTKVFSPTGKKEKTLAQEISLKSKGVTFDGPVELSLLIFYRHGDLDNYIKTICDALQKSGLLKNDSQVKKILASQIANLPNLIEIERIS